MPIPAGHLAPFVYDGYYPVFNHGAGKENVFYPPENYRYFLQKLDEYIGDWVDVYAWCLMPNHFHLLIRVKHQANAQIVQALG